MLRLVVLISAIMSVPLSAIAWVLDYQVKYTLEITDCNFYKKE